MNDPSMFQVGMKKGNLRRKKSKGRRMAFKNGSGIPGTLQEKKKRAEGLLLPPASVIG
jgi:hypothetical protein